MLAEFLHEIMKQQTSLSAINPRSLRRRKQEIKFMNMPWDEKDLKAKGIRKKKTKMLWCYMQNKGFFHSTYKQKISSQCIWMNSIFIVFSPLTFAQSGPVCWALLVCQSYYQVWARGCRRGRACLTSREVPFSRRSHSHGQQHRPHNFKQQQSHCQRKWNSNCDSKL